ncbi:competence protein CoiA family protein [Bacillus changyiensis]|uniref:competence protein CoiA family protein n=1 Tax=Bacillus changyiensis TaxID=3004103 RepID=UPI0022E56C76|nr:competence protein CoiA family protein [Bacillus changyiensis]MDA1475909.1 competence protein CoiA family protein [Bacillus changyiensis]
MLSAIMKEGQLICLGDGYRANELKRLRTSHSFYCPVCHHEVKLKVGEKRIYHFAHQPDAACPVSYEQESVYHLQGKQLLYQWLKKQGLKPVLEPYIKKVKQRPDVLVKCGMKMIAIEFQCATLNLTDYQKRTTGLVELGIDPIWIIGGNRVKRLANSFFQLSEFHWQFVQRKEKHSKLLFFCPEQKAFLILDQLTPFLKNKSSASVTYLPLQQTRVTSFMTSSKRCSSLQLSGWKRNLLHFRTTSHRFFTKDTKQMMELFYQKLHISLPFFPSEVFIPVPSGSIFSHPVFVWQGYLYLYMIDRSPFRLDSAVCYMHQLIQTKRLKLRWNHREKVIDAVNEYAFYLYKKGFLSKKQNVYDVNRPLYKESCLATLLKRDAYYFSE